MAYSLKLLLKQRPLKAAQGSESLIKFAQGIGGLKNSIQRRNNMLVAVFVQESLSGRGSQCTPAGESV